MYKMLASDLFLVKTVSDGDVSLAYPGQVEGL